LIHITTYQHCVCQRMAGKNPKLCEGAQTFSERGKKVKLTPHPGEQVCAIVLDGCVLQDNQPKCDGLFLLCSRGQAYAVLVELKGVDIAHAFAQLAYVRYQRQAYQNLRDQLAQQCTGRLIEQAFIISNTFCSLPVKEKLEEEHKIRVKAILHSEPTSKIPELRDYL